MAPLTRNRATHGTDVPRQLNAEYYAQRADAGLIIAEATQISPVGKGYAWTPGIYSEEQIAGWRLVTDAVHERRGRDLSAALARRALLASIAAAGRAAAGRAVRNRAREPAHVHRGRHVPDGRDAARAYRVRRSPRRLTTIARPRAMRWRRGSTAWRSTAPTAICSTSSCATAPTVAPMRTAGSVANRMRFPLEVVDAVAGAIGPEKTGIRISPVTPASGLWDSRPAAVFFPYVDELSLRKLAYVHVIEGATGGQRDLVPFDFHGTAAALRRTVDGEQRLHARHGDRRRSHTATRISWPSGGPTLRIPIWSTGCASMRRSRPSHRTTFSAATTAATPIIRGARWRGFRARDRG